MLIYKVKDRKQFPKLVASSKQICSIFFLPDCDRYYFYSTSAAYQLICLYVCKCTYVSAYVSVFRYANNR
ncbi:hypothetical protein C2G38_2105069 [Gigaspora rosea]|uniref:Uncharacterized protein n=1 Tax=Gigaspora rosea TaxID=44941 RepID=A0A397UQ16_9GLOM|nr:hypothetical protein C2G38_2105069 [Gigaspora rosea]